MQAQPQQQPIIQIPPLPPEPHCVVWYKGSPCDVVRQQYQQALQARAAAIIQQQRQLAAQQATEQATAQYQPELENKQQQIDQLQKANADLQQQLAQLRTDTEQKLQQQTSTAFKEKVAAHDEGVFHGFAIGFGAALLLAAIALGVRLLLRKFRIARRGETKTAVRG